MWLKAYFIFSCADKGPRQQQHRPSCEWKIVCVHCMQMGWKDWTYRSLHTDSGTAADKGNPEEIYPETENRTMIDPLQLWVFMSTAGLMTAIILLTGQPASRLPSRQIPIRARPTRRLKTTPDEQSPVTGPKVLDRLRFPISGIAKDGYSLNRNTQLEWTKLYKGILYLAKGLYSLILYF